MPKFLPSGPASSSGHLSKSNHCNIIWEKVSPQAENGKNSVEKFPNTGIGTLGLQFAKASISSVVVHLAPVSAEVPSGFFARNSCKSRLSCNVCVSLSRRWMMAWAILSRCFTKSGCNFLAAWSAKSLANRLPRAQYRCKSSSMSLMIQCAFTFTNVLWMEPLSNQARCKRSKCSLSEKPLGDVAENIVLKAPIATELSEWIVPWPISSMRSMITCISARKISCSPPTLLQIAGIHVGGLVSRKRYSLAM